MIGVDVKDNGSADLGPIAVSSQGKGVIDHSPHLCLLGILDRCLGKDYYHCPVCLSINTWPGPAFGPEINFLREAYPRQNLDQRGDTE